MAEPTGNEIPDTDVINKRQNSILRTISGSYISPLNREVGQELQIQTEIGRVAKAWEEFQRGQAEEIAACIKGWSNPLGSQMAQMASASHGIGGVKSLPGLSNVSNQALADSRALLSMSGMSGQMAAFNDFLMKDSKLFGFAGINPQALLGFKGIPSGQVQVTEWVAGRSWMPSSGLAEAIAGTVKPPIDIAEFLGSTGEAQTAKEIALQQLAEHFEEQNKQEVMQEWRELQDEFELDIDVETDESIDEIVEQTPEFPQEVGERLSQGKMPKPQVAATFFGVNFVVLSRLTPSEKLEFIAVALDLFYSTFRELLKEDPDVLAFAATFSIYALYLFSFAWRIDDEDTRGNEGH